MTVCYLGISVGLLFVSGYGVTRLCLRDEDATLRWVITPSVGLALWVVLIENLGFLGLGTMKSAPLALFGLTIFAIGVRLRTAHPASRSGEPSLKVWGLSCLCLAFMIWPMLLLSHKDYIGFANPDAWLYFSMADYLQHHSYWAFPYTSTDISYHPMLALVKAFQAIHHRVGEAYWVSSVASLLRSDTKEIYQIVHATAYLLIPLSTYAMCRLGFGLDWQQSLLAMFLVGVNAVLALIYYQQLLGHIMGLTILPLILGMGARLIHAPRAGPVVLLGLLLGGIFTIYPELFLFAVIPLGSYLILSWPKLTHRNMYRLGVVVILVMIAVNPIYWLHGLDYLWRQLAATPGGRTYFYAFSPIMFPMYWGLTSSPLVFANLLPPLMLMTQLAVIFPLACGLLGATGFGIQRLARLRNTAPLSYLIAYVLIGVGLLVSRGKYTYGFFKFLSYTQFLVLTALAVGLVELWRMGELGTGRRTWKWMAATLGLGYLGLNFVSAMGFAFISIQQRASFGLRNAIELPRSQAYHELQSIRSMVGPEESVMVDVVSLIPQLYLTHYLKDMRISIPQPASYIANLYKEPLPLHHSFKDPYLLEIRDAARDVVVNQAPEPLWKNRTFALSRFPQPYVSLVIPNPMEDVETNWYTLEYDWRLGRPFRWVNNDPMVRVIGRPGMRLSLVVELEPPTWDPSPLRTIDLYVNDALLQTVRVVGRTRLLSVPFDLPSDNALVRLHIREEAKTLPIKHPVLRFLLGDSRDVRKLNLRVYSIGVRPILSPSQVLGDRIEFSPGFLATNWKGQYNVEGLENDLWILDQLRIRLWREKRSVLLVLRGSFPRAMSLRTIVNGLEAGIVRIPQPGEQDVYIRLPNGASRPGLHDITIRADTFIVPRDQGINQDPRRLSFRVHRLYLQ